MLVLTRKAEERIQIGNDICIVVLRVQRQRVKIGIEAPSGVLVVRSELLNSPQRRQPRTTSHRDAKLP